MGLFNWKSRGPIPTKETAEEVTTIGFHDVEQIEDEIEQFKIDEAPFSTTIDPHELYLLQKSGYEPLQVVFGNVVYSMGIQGVLRSVWRALRRGEMSEFSRLNEDARRLALVRMLGQAKKLGATGVVSVRLNAKETADFLELTMVGTAVRRVRNPVLATTEDPLAVGV